MKPTPEGDAGGARAAEEIPWRVVDAHRAHAARAMGRAACAEGRAWREAGAEAACALAHALLWLHGRAPGSHRGVAQLVREVRQLAAREARTCEGARQRAYRVLAKRVGPTTRTRASALDALARALEAVAIVAAHTQEGMKMDRAGEMAKGYGALAQLAAASGLDAQASEWLRTGAEGLRAHADRRAVLRARKTPVQGPAMGLEQAHAGMLALAEACEEDAEIEARDAALKAARCVEKAMQGEEERAHARAARAGVDARRRARIQRMRCETAQGAAVLRALREVPRNEAHGERMRCARRALDAEECALEALGAERETQTLAHAITALYASAPRAAGTPEHEFGAKSASALWESDRARCVRAADHASEGPSALAPALTLCVESMRADIEDTDARVDAALERAARGLGDTAVAHGDTAPHDRAGWTVRACDGRAAARNESGTLGPWTRRSVVDVEAPAAVYAVNRSAAFEGCVRALERYGTSDRAGWEAVAEQIAQAQARVRPVREALEIGGRLHR